jgi:hypothetical protein
MPYLGVWRLYQELLRLRRSDPALAFAGDTSQPSKPPNSSASSLDAAALGRDTPAIASSLDAAALGPDTVAIWRRPEGAQALLLVARLRGEGPVEVPDGHEQGKPPGRWNVVLTTEDRSFTEDTRRLRVDAIAGRLTIAFERPGAILFRRLG